ncbi:MAG: hypothetical protein U0794_20565 [Isosphaeraceae bacterium]
MTTSPLLIHGAGGHAKVVADIARALGYRVVAFVEDPPTRDGQPYYGSIIVSWDRFVGDPDTWRGAQVALAVGDNAARQHAYERFVARGRAIVTLVHPTAVVSPTARLGTGTVVMPTAVVNADATTGIGVIVNTGAVAEHDTILGDLRIFPRMPPWVEVHRLDVERIWAWGPSSCPV